jgi:hypothetical protein|nr:MAG TPA: hypothetical protein [Caudoviricetes sp.]
MNDTIAELQERLDDYTDAAFMEIINDGIFGELQDLRNIADDAIRVARDLAEELDGMKES